MKGIVGGGGSLYLIVFMNMETKQTEKIGDPLDGQYKIENTYMDRQKLSLRDRSGLSHLISLSEVWRPMTSIFPTIGVLT